MPSRERWKSIEDVRSEAVICCRCDLCHNRTHVVFGSGPAPAPLTIVGEGPGADEDKQGKPFVGRAGKLLDRVLVASGIRREDVWITNTVRCRPTIRDANALRNRAPNSDEVRACDLWMGLEYQFVAPRGVVCLGLVPGKALISKGIRIGADRGRWLEGRSGIPSLITYHPAYALRVRDDERKRVESMMIEDLSMASRVFADEHPDVGRA